jgi:hypothetical protein
MIWRHAVEQRLEAVKGARTWDLYADVYGPAADIAREHGGGIGELIALTVHMVGTIRGEKVTGGERARISQLVRFHGKVVLFAIAEAIPRVDDPSISAVIRYAAVVCRTSHQRIRAGQAAEAARATDQEDAATCSP